MATNTFVEIDLPEAINLADYTGIEYDLRSARDFAQMLLDEGTKERPNWALSDPLMTATIVRYARPFATGVRLRLGDAALAVLTPGQLAKHEQLCVIRNKYIVHSVNAFEESRPVARYWRERVKDEGISSIECNHHRIVGLSKQNLQDIVELTTAMLSYVKDRLAEEKAKVLGIVRAMPLGKILARTQPTTFPSNSDPKKPRRGGTG
jgi:hypothetical protein